VNFVDYKSRFVQGGVDAASDPFFILREQYARAVRGAESGTLI
jgi:hypothetical protein